MTESGAGTAPPREPSIGRRAGIALTVSGVVIATGFASLAGVMGPHQHNATPTQYRWENRPPVSGEPGVVPGADTVSRTISSSATPPPTSATVTTTQQHGSGSKGEVAPRVTCVSGRQVVLRAMTTSLMRESSALADATTPPTTPPTTTATTTTSDQAPPTTRTTTTPSPDNGGDGGDGGSGNTGAGNPPPPPPPPHHTQC